MPDYEYFLKVLEEDFGEFVLSRRVNLYLQTIGPEIKGEELRDGVLYEFTIVSGYEEERGHWATALHHKLRFGDEVIPVDGLPDPIVLTPNFFYGRNLKGEEIEYRLGLIRTAQNVEICPVILRKTADGIIAKVLFDLCVIYTGLFIDPETAKLLGEQRAVELTTYQEFLTSFWNIDDYLRKQNPNFHSDYDIQLWQAIEVFSGRIINQMLARIMDLGQNESDWIIPEAHTAHGLKIITSIERALDERDLVSENQILIYFKHLCSFIAQFDDKPLKILAEKNINLVPYLLKFIVNPPEEEMGLEAYNVLKKIIEQYPHFIQSEVQEIIQTLQFQWRKKRRPVYGILDHILKKQPSMAQDFLIISLQCISSPDKILRASAIFTYKRIIELYPEYLNKKHLRSFQLLLDDPYKRVRILILRIFKQAIKKDPELITQFFLKRICSLLLDPNGHVKIAALETFELTLPYLPDHIAQKAIATILRQVNTSNINLRKFILQLLQILLINRPYLFKMSDIEPINHSLSLQNPKRLTTTLKAQKLIIQQNPQLLNNTSVDKLSQLLLHPSKKIKILVLKNLGYLFVKCPAFFNLKVIKRISDVFLESNGNVRFAALWVYRAITLKTPYLIEPKVIDKLTKLFHDPNRKIRKTARRIYMLFTKANFTASEYRYQEIPTKIPPY